MREHPIPQDIVGYRFHIIGSMTLKQFAELALGAILGLIIYSTNLPTPIKWPLIFAAAALGAAAAFLPIEERPLDYWIITFFKTLYRPTKFFWKKSSKIPDVFLFKVGEGIMEKKDDVDLTPIRRKRIKEYLDSTKLVSNYQNGYDEETRARLEQIMKTFGEVNPQTIEATRQLEKPALKVRVRSLKQASTQKSQSPTTDTHNTETILNTNQVAQEVRVPAAELTTAQKQNQPDQKEEKLASPNQDFYVANTQAQTNRQQKKEKSVIFNAALPFPSTPTVANKLVGMVLTANSELIPEAIIEIKDEHQRVVRAVKSNALGQFFISTPLKKGNYTISISHPKYQFNSQEIVLKNKLVDPIEVRSLT